MKTTLSYYPPTAPPAELPLGRYLPPIPAGLAAGWLRENLPPGAWVLDPFGASPNFALEAAAAGFRVMAVCNNPVLAFLLETLASAPSRAEFQSVLADLAAARRGDERMEVYINTLYASQCPNCGLSLPARSYLWKRGETQPTARQIVCPQCGDLGDLPLAEIDLTTLAALGPDSLHRARAVQRLNLDDIEAQEAAQEALQTYLPRPLVTLFSLINKSEGLNLTPRRRQLLQALLLSLCDQASALWPAPAGRSRPRQITFPAQFREVNLWAALEAAPDLWPAAAPVPCLRWPEMPPPSGGITLVPARLKSVLPVPIDFQAAAAVLPRPNQAFWTFSAIWAGWLWGASATQPLRTSLERRRYDWAWHTTALHRTFQAMSTHLPPRLPFFALLPDLAPGFLSAAFLSAASSRHAFLDLRVEPDADLAQALWRMPEAPGPAADSSPTLTQLRGAVQTAVLAHLRERAEPAPYILLHAAALQKLEKEGLLAASDRKQLTSRLSDVQTSLSAVFQMENGPLRRLDTAAPVIEGGLWWLSSPPIPESEPLSDQVEREVIRALSGGQPWTLPALHAALAARFAGLFSPSDEWLSACLESYAAPAPQNPQTWVIKAQEIPRERQSSLRQARAQLTRLGQRLGYQVSGSMPVLWSEHQQAEFAFYPFASSILSRHLFAPPAARHNVLVFPASRALLILRKLEFNPQLAQAAAGWHFLKLRHLRRLGQSPSVTRESLPALLDQDPLGWEEAVQMSMFD